MRIPLKDTKQLIIYPVNWKPKTVDQCLAAIVGYNLGDGTITKRKYGHSAGFYGENGGLEQICDCFNIAFKFKPKVGFKKGLEPKFNTYQIQVGRKEIVRHLIHSGCIVGKKVAQSFVVPEWICSHSDNDVKRAFVSALWGAEGSTPRQQHRVLKPMVLNMHKNNGEDFNIFFNQIQNMMSELGIKTTKTTGKSTTGASYNIYIKAGVDNNIKFLSKCGYIFSDNKADKAWLWIQYLKALQYDSINRREKVIGLVPKYGYAETAKQLGLTRGGVFSTYNSKATAFQATRNFPKFNIWVAERSYNGGLRLNIIKKRTIDKKIKMFNVLVSSKDHSYLLANGIDNFNSFETASGRVYADYSNKNHTDKILDPGKEIIWTHDWNFTPLSSAILQIHDDKIYMVDEIVLESAVARNTALEFVNRFKDCKSSLIKVYGDAQGHHGEKHGIKSDYMQIEEILKKHGFRVQIKAKHNYKPIKESQSSLRAKILNAAGERSFFVNSNKCEYGDKGLKLTQLKAGSTFQEADSEYQHITTALRYFTDVEFPIKGRAGVSETSW